MHSHPHSVRQQEATRELMEGKRASWVGGEVTVGCIVVAVVVVIHWEAMVKIGRWLLALSMICVCLDEKRLLLIQQIERKGSDGEGGRVHLQA